MKEDELKSALAKAWRHVSPRPNVASCIFIFVVGASAGWAGHNWLWRSDSLDYAIRRAIELSATCKDITIDEQVRNIEDRIGRPASLFRLDDKLLALDYVFDRIEADECLAK